MPRVDTESLCTQHVPELKASLRNAVEIWRAPCRSDQLSPVFFLEKVLGHSSSRRRGVDNEVGKEIVCRLRVGKVRARRTRG